MASISAERISAWLDSYRLGAKDALAAAAAAGYRLVQPSALDPVLNPAALSRSGRRHLAHYLSSLGLRADAFGALYPGGGLAEPARADERLERLGQTLELCADLGVTAAVTSLAGLDDPGRAELARQALDRAAEMADRFGVRVSLLTPGSEAVKLLEELNRLGSPLLSIGLDTAALPSGTDAAALLARGVGELQLRDIRRAGSQFEETEFGKGDVDFRGLLRALRECDYRGGVAVRRDRAADPVDALRAGRQYVGSLLAETANQ